MPGVPVIRLFPRPARRPGYVRAVRQNVRFIEPVVAVFAEGIAIAGALTNCSSGQPSTWPENLHAFGPSMQAFPPHALELLFVFLLGHELAGLLAALGIVLLTHDFGLDLGALANCAIAVIVSDRCIGGHGTSPFGEERSR